MAVKPGLALLIALGAQQPEVPAPPSEGRPIVVTGQPLDRLRRRLADCIARACPTGEDVDASLALAEGEFLEGDYDGAARTIAASLRRNRRHGARFPEPVADLYRAQARVMRHRGRDLQSRLAIRRILEVLREGLPQEDHRHFTARLEIVDMLVRIGNFREARDELAELARRAAASGRDDVRRMAEMRRLRLDYFIAPRRTLTRLDQLAHSNDPDQAFEMISARLLLAAIHRMEGDVARSDALLAGIPGGAERQLLFTPPFLADVRAHARSDAVPLRVSSDFRDAWVDVAYWIGPDGRITDAEVVRHGAEPSWAEPLLRAIRGRVYSRSPDGQPSYRLERYTFIAPLVIRHGARGGMVRDAARARIEYMDLTVDEEPGRARSPAIAPADGPDAPETPGKQE